LKGVPVFSVEENIADRYDGGKKTWIRKTRGAMNNEYR